MCIVSRHNTITFIFMRQIFIDNVSLKYFENQVFVLAKHSKSYENEAIMNITLMHKLGGENIVLDTLCGNDEQANLNPNFTYDVHG